MSKIATAFLLSLCINGMLYFAELSFQDAGTTSSILNNDNNFLTQYKTNNGTLLNETITGRLPDSSASTSPITGNIYTDFWTSIKDFFSTIGKGAEYLIAFLTAVPHFLMAMNLPEGMVFVISAIWYLYNLFIFLLFMWGDRS